jgi:hypothetical protein
MDTPEHTYCTAFEGYRRIASGDLAQVVLKTKAVIDRGEKGPVLIFDDVTSEPIEVDFRGTSDDVLKRLPRAPLTESATPEEPGPRGPGRPRLGVVAREVTLLPRHWHWLNDQPGGASVALRKLVQHGMRANAGKDRIRASQNAAYQFMSAMAGNRAGFEEAARALFAGDARSFNRRVDAWPKDVRDLVKKLAAVALQAETTAA